MEGRRSRCQVTTIIKSQERSWAQGHKLVIPATWTQRQAEVQGQPGQFITTHPIPKVGNHDLLSVKGQRSVVEAMLSIHSAGTSYCSNSKERKS